MKMCYCDDLLPYAQSCRDSITVTIILSMEASQPYPHAGPYYCLRNEVCMIVPSCVLYWSSYALLFLHVTIANINYSSLVLILYQ